MSQSNKRRGSGKPAQEAGAPRKTTPGVVRQPVNARRGGQPSAQSQSSLRAQMDRALPPFSTRRYIAIWAVVAVPIILVFLLLIRPGGGSQGTLPAATVVPGSPQAVGAASGSSGPGKYMVIDTDKGQIVAKLYTDPSANVGKTVANFEQKANSGYFNGLIFHRVEDWVVQGGDPAGTGTGGKMMPSEYNQLPFNRGALGVARRNDPTQNNDSQFFIVKVDSPHLNGQYTNWGQVAQGMDVVDKLAVGDKMNKVSVEERK